MGNNFTITVVAQNEKTAMQILILRLRKSEGLKHF